MYNTPRQRSHNLRRRNLRLNHSELVTRGVRRNDDNCNKPRRVLAQQYNDGEIARVARRRYYTANTAEYLRRGDYDYPLD